MIGEDQWDFTHQGAYGGYRDLADRDVGAYWIANTDNIINIWRRQDDQVWGSSRWVQVRLLIWIRQTPHKTKGKRRVESVKRKE
jgi:hypothetical protein